MILRDGTKISIAFLDLHIYMFMNARFTLINSQIYAAATRAQSNHCQRSVKKGTGSRFTVTFMLPGIQTVLGEPKRLLVLVTSSDITPLKFTHRESVPLHLHHLVV